MVAVVVAGLLAGCGSSAAPPAKASTAAAKAGAGAVGATGSTASSGAASSKKLVQVTFTNSFIPQSNQLPFYLAQAAGYYRDEGLDVTITQGKGSAIAAQQVGAGQFDFGQADATAMALTHAKGADVVSVMSEFAKTPFGLFTARDEGIANWKDLYGKKITVSAGSPETFLLPATFSKLRLDYKRLDIINTSPANKVPEYIDKRADAVGTDLSNYIPVVDPKRPSNHLFFGDVIDVPGYTVIARSAYVKAHPQVTREFVAATQRALQALLTDPAAVKQATDAMIRQSPGQSLNAQQIIASWAICKQFITIPADKGHPLGWQSPQVWSRTIQVLHRYGGLKGDLDAAQYYTNAYLPAS
jgi:NitT/TauT family transport system substrate-binding protein